MKRLLYIAIFVISASAINAQAQSLETVQYFDHGIRSLEKTEYERALNYFNKSLKSAERSHAGREFRAKIHYNIGAALYNLKRTAAACEKFNEALKLSNGRYEKASHALNIARNRMNGHDARAEARTH